MNFRRTMLVNLERLQKMLFSLQPRPACPISIRTRSCRTRSCRTRSCRTRSCRIKSCRNLLRNDRLFLQRLQRSRRTLDLVIGRQRSAHHRSGLPLPRLQRPVRALCAHHSPHHGRGAGRLRGGLLPRRPNPLPISLVLVDCRCTAGRPSEARHSRYNRAIRRPRIRFDPGA